MESNECFGVGLKLVTLAVTLLRGWSCKNRCRLFKTRKISSVFAVKLSVTICNLSVAIQRDRQERKNFLLTCKVVQTREINGLQPIKSDKFRDWVAGGRERAARVIAVAVFIVTASEGEGTARVDAHWLLSGVIRRSLNGSGVLVSHVPSQAAFFLAEAARLGKQFSSPRAESYLLTDRPLRP